MHRILKHNSFSSDQLHSNVDHTYFNIKHSCLVIINLAVSADNNFFFLFVPENRICHFMQIVCNLHKMPNPVLRGKYEKTISKCLLLKFLSRLLSLKITKITSPSIVPDKTLFFMNRKVFSLFCRENILCCGYSLKVPH